MSGAGPSPRSTPARKSFAQVAAAAHKSPIPHAQALMNASSDSQKPSQQAVVDASVSDTDVEQSTPQAMPAIVKSAEAPPDGATRLNIMMKGVTLDEHPGAGLDQIGRKENSDTKSVASRTTFTLDEKESLRPDDSASMQAGGDDDSPSESVIAGAKLNSSSDARAFRDQLYEIDRTESSRLLAQRQIGGTSQRNGGILYANSPGAPQQQVDGSQQPQSNGPPPGLIIPPDEKLQEALASPKDRLFVLKVEQDLIDFVKDSTDHELQLPQTNAFYRMLCHKLAEYYFLGHVVDDSMSAVRIFRLPHSRLPPPLINSESKPEGTTPPPTNSARRIMRRGAGEPHLLSRDSDGEGSHNKPDTAGSGSGSDEDNKDGQNKPKDKSSLTREEREKQYAEVRARIFEDFSESKAESDAGTGQDSKEVSRPSSASGQRKKTKKRPKDDSFEARSAYSQFNGQSYVNQGMFRAQNNAPYYPAMGGYSGYPSASQQYSPLQGYQMEPGPMMPQDYASGVPWVGQQYGVPYNMNQSMNTMPQPAPSHYDSSSSPFPQYPNQNMHAMQSQSTPKPHQPSLAGYYHGFQHSPNSSPWMQQTAPHGYGSPKMYPGAGDGGQYMMSYAPQSGYPADFQQQQGFQGQAFDAYQANFNPQSQAFIPRAHTSQWPHLGPQVQPQHLSSAYNSPRYSNTSQNISATRSNQSQSQNSKKSSQTSGNMDSITKWATPANLPAKPPPPNSSFHLQTQKGHQSLPSHPLATSNASPYKQ